MMALECLPVIGRKVSVCTIVCLAFALALSMNAAADEHAIPAGESYSLEVELSSGELFSYSWSSNVDLDFSVRDPSGIVVQSESSVDFDVDVLWPSTSGTYTLRWVNNEAVAAQLTYDLHGFGYVEDAISWVFWGAVIAAIVIVSIVVIVVIVVVMGGRKTPAQQPAGPQPQAAAQAAATGHCPTCGTLLDPNASFCPRCGMRYK
jgi:hypothetical protein